MKIVKMTPSKKVKDRYYADLEDGSTLKVNTALIADYSLFSGRELAQDELEKLRGDAVSSELKARALRMIGARPMSRKEITGKLTEKGAEPEAAEDTADWLERLGLINDREYAGMIARHYTGKGYGQGRVRDELYKRGVPKDYWDEALSEISGGEAAIDRLVAAKLRGAEPDTKTIKKLTDMLLRRGYAWGEVKAALERYGSSLEETDDYDI